MYKLIYVIFSTLLLSESAMAAYDQYTITDLGSLSSNSSDDFSYAFDINDRGDIVGFSRSNGLDYGFTWTHSDGMWSTVPGRVTGINNSRYIAGWNPKGIFYVGDIGLSTSFHPLGKSKLPNFYGPMIKINDWGQGVMVANDGVYFFNGANSPGFFGSVVSLKKIGDWDFCYPSTIPGINNRGDAVFNGYAYRDYDSKGNIILGTRVYHGTTDTKSVAPSSSKTGYFLAINDNGIMVGTNGYGYFIAPATEMQDGLFVNGVAFNISKPPTTSPDLLDVNNSGYAVGGIGYPSTQFQNNTVCSPTQVNYLRAFITSAEEPSFAYLDTLVPALQWKCLGPATAINNAGQIVGVGINPQGKTHAFLLTPIRNW
ncbi:hypothetical protein [Methylomagnum sp.]